MRMTNEGAGWTGAMRTASPRRDSARRRCALGAPLALVALLLLPGWASVGASPEPADPIIGATAGLPLDVAASAPVECTDGSGAAVADGPRLVDSDDATGVATAPALDAKLVCIVDLGQYYVLGAFRIAWGEHMQPAAALGGDCPSGVTRFGLSSGRPGSWQPQYGGETNGLVPMNADRVHWATRFVRLEVWSASDCGDPSVAGANTLNLFDQPWCNPNGQALTCCLVHSPLHCFLHGSAPPPEALHSVDVVAPDGVEAPPRAPTAAPTDASGIAIPLDVAAGAQTTCTDGEGSAVPGGERLVDSDDATDVATAPALDAKLVCIVDLGQYYVLGAFRIAWGEHMRPAAALGGDCPSGVTRFGLSSGAPGSWRPRYGGETNGLVPMNADRVHWATRFVRLEVWSASACGTPSVAGANTLNLFDQPWCNPNGDALTCCLVNSPLSCLPHHHAQPRGWRAHAS